MHLYSPNSRYTCRFASQFKDEYKIPKGSVIELSKDRGHVLRTKSKTSFSLPFLLLCYLKFRVNLLHDCLSFP